MPTYLVHGFRWPRPLIRIHIILQNLDDAAAEWLMAPATYATLFENFETLYPELMTSLPSLRFIEQYDPNDTTSKSQPYAYVCDQVHEVSLGVDVDEVRGKGLANDAWGALVELRDKIAPGEKVAWFVVVNGDIERWAPPTVGLLEGSAGGSAGSGVSQTSPESGGSSVIRDDTVMEQTKAQPKGFKKWFGGRGLRKPESSKNMRNSNMDNSIKSDPGTPPPLPVAGTAV
ncbi:hypothetical protein K432DRAFT_401758 [Lepidopterella palustris CBS 459.81]|uniref:Uncharacterized protein n=1 Tax=Lepidopterella palustris CBS 459.81 TaxID=1314670 RepID=A0A8E2JIX5_9PEZI|nr:hypothetical protein K432DRAFT_401758 [Lepidopterella palustris CBS 459.81]